MPFLLVIACWIFGVFMWGANIYKLTENDFERPYKSEIIRIIGIPVAPMGFILGFMTIGDEEQN